MENELVVEIRKTHEEFKSYVDRELAEIKKNGVAAPETVEAIERMNKRMDALQANLERPGTGTKSEEKGDAALSAYMRKGWNGMDATQVTKALSVGSDPDGGYLVMPQQAGIITGKVYETSPMRAICGSITIGTDAYEFMVDNDEVTYGWVGEKSSRTETATPTLKKGRIEVHELYAMPSITQKMLDDAAFNVEGWLGGKVADKIGRVSNAAFVTGNGVGKPRGITDYTTAATADATRAWGTLEHVLSGAAGAFAASAPADKLFDLIYALKPAYRNGARFVTNRQTIGAIRKIKDSSTAANYLWQPGLQEGEPQRVLGYPVTDAEDMPALATDSLSLAFGNFNEGYLIVDRQGIRVLRDPFTAKPYVLYYTTARVGGGVVNSEAIKFMKFNS